MDRTATETAIKTILTEIHERLDKASRIARQRAKVLAMLRAPSGTTTTAMMKARRGAQEASTQPDLQAQR